MLANFITIISMDAYTCKYIDIHICIKEAFIKYLVTHNI